ncbi:MAG TPA: HNH endonuclease signature motif containing protein, partial [Ilumatobacteraceae bacterium]
NRAQRRALHAMYPTCPIPGCAVSAQHCQPHHIHYWRNMGLTDLDNLVPLCSKHHHLVHEGSWKLAMAANRALTITYPDGTIQTTGPPARTTRVA